MDMKAECMHVSGVSLNAKLVKIIVPAISKD